ncbi:MAG: hypothetical protein GX053_09225 [Tissierella sp.]|nr:hypothetical protein [Tissierella sp.]
MKKNNKFGLVIAIALLVAIGFGGFKLTEPSYALRMDVNPSIEIVSNRLNRVVEVNPLNDDAREMLKDYKIGNKDLKNTIEDLADLMVLTGYISGGKDNLVMITVEDDSANSDIVNKLNRAITAYLENKQIEATIVNQSIPKENISEKTSKEIVAEKISELDDDLDFEKIADMTLRELMAYAESKNIAPQSLFNRVVRTAKHNENENRVNGINDHKDDDDDHNHKDNMKDNNKNGDKNNKNGNKNNDNNKNGNKDNNNNKNGDKIFKSNGNNKSETLIGEAKARKIALELVNGEIVEFKLNDYDDGDDDTEYEVKIIANGYKYEIEIDAYTGKVLEFERDGKANIKDNKQLIGEAKARKIALDLVNGKIVKFELDDYDDDDDDDPKYEIEIIADGHEYEIEIDAYTGKVLEFEKDN